MRLWVCFHCWSIKGVWSAPQTTGRDLSLLEQWFKLYAPPVMGQKYLFFFSCNMNCTFDRGRKQKEASRENYKYWDLTKWEWVGHTHSVESLGLQMSSFISNNHHRWLKCLTQASVLLFSGEWGWGGQQLLAIACTLLIWGKQFSGKLTSNCVVPKPRKSEHAIQETDLQH